MKMCASHPVSLVMKDVPPFTSAGGVVAKPKATVHFPITLETDLEDLKKGMIPIKKK